ncbi:ribbon-helix-helix protein, CopG family [Rhizobium sp. TH2]|uniref:ribbon-helix-helix domain-containing protein n=1 Tax=Rhizobium sp. TH2 TaxID=2775403 RepID=UPI00220A1618|nr:ribbon-helix-helix protein, CopG family [Rhizobium sp. TH2]
MTRTTVKQRRITISLPASDVRARDSFCEDHGFSSRSEAVRQLITMGFEVEAVDNRKVMSKLPGNRE